jgi:hypothetical protein
MADPEFQEVIKSEHANKLVEKEESTYIARLHGNGEGETQAESGWRESR